METIERIKKGISFLRGFQDLSNKELYRKAVLRFIDVVEEYINGEDEVFKNAKKMFEKEEGDLNQEPA